MLPGPELAAALAQVDPSRLNGHDLVAAAPAFLKMISHFQAGLARVLNEVEYCPPGDGDSPAERSEHTNRWAGIEVAAKLHWSVRKAEVELRYAYQMVRRLPLVHAALGAGIIDWHQARVIVDGVAFLEDLPAQVVAAKVLAEGAGGWTVRRLADRLRREAIRYDEQAAARRRRVQAERHPDGTADLYGLNLPPERVAQILERIGAIARTGKRQGDRRTVDQLMADVFCDLLAGSGVGAVPAGPVSNPGPTGHPDIPEDEPVDEVPEDDPVDVPVDEVPEDEPDGGAVDESGTGAADPGPATAPAGSDGGGVVPLPGPRRGVIHLMAPLSTVVGISQEPGELAGFGPVAADIVRQVIADNPQAQWRFSLFDDASGGLFAHGITQVRPDPPAVGGRGGFSAADAAYIRARDGTCRGPAGCSVSASDCEIDHTLARVDGGGHERGNGGCMCKREHMYKHRSGARLEQPEPGVFVWTTALGHTYEVRPEPYFESTELPETGSGQPSPSARRLARILAGRVTAGSSDPA